MKDKLVSENEVSELIKRKEELEDSGMEEKNGGMVEEAEQKESNVRGLEVKKPVFADIEDTSTGKSGRNLDLIMDVPLELSVVLGKTKKTIEEVLGLGAGSVVGLNKLADEPLEVHVNGKLIARGEVVVINENFGIRITQIVSKDQRVLGLK